MVTIKKEYLAQLNFEISVNNGGEMIAFLQRTVMTLTFVIIVLPATIWVQKPLLSQFVGFIRIKNACNERKNITKRNKLNKLIETRESKGEKNKKIILAMLKNKKRNGRRAT